MTKQTKLYIESYLSKKDAGSVEYTIDFQSIDEAQALFLLINPDIEYSPFKFYKIIAPYHGKNRMFSGSWYSLPNRYFENASYEAISDDSEGSAVYSGVIRIKNFCDDFPQFLTHVDGNDYPSVQSIVIDFNDKLKELRVVNCGQGNWNEIHTKSETLIYDLGASSNFNQYQLQSLVNRRFSSFFNSKIDIVISHWDMDHFQALKYLSTSQLSKINAVYGPDNLPPSNVYSDAMDNLSKNNVNCYLVAPTTIRTGNRIDLNLLSSSQTVDVFRAVKGSSRNQTGIVLVVKGQDKTVLLTGDHHYPKILNAIHNRYLGKSAILVAPHHGGMADNLSVSDWKKEFANVTCCISVGQNSYGHPSQNLSKLDKLQNSSSDRTDTKGDITYTL